MNFNHVAKCVCLTGRKGTGKTHKFLELWDCWPAKYKFAFDPDREIARKRKLKVCLTVEQMKAALAQGIPVLFDPSQLFPGKRTEAFAFFCRWVYEVSKTLQGVKLFSIDEIQKWTSTKIGGVPAAFNEILDDGRKQEIDLLMIVNKGMNKLAEDIRGQLTELYVYRTVGSRGLDWLEEELELDRARARNLKMPANGRGGEFIYYVL